MTARVPCRRRPLLVASALAPLLALAAAGRAAAEPQAAEAFVERTAPSIVTLKYVLKYPSGEREQEARGAVIDPAGLVVLSSSYLGSGQAKVVNLHVLFGSDPKEWEAVVVAQDSILRLAYVQVLELGEKRLEHVDLGKGAEPRLGQDLRGVTRDARGFDFAPWLTHHYVSARLEKPRSMWAFSGDSMVPGLPLFDGEGRPVGVTAYQRGSEGADEEGDSGGWRVFLLPLADVGKSVESARKKVPEAVAKAAEAKAAGKEGPPAMGGGGEEKPAEEAPGGEKPPQNPPGKPPENPPAPPPEKPETPK